MRYKFKLRSEVEKQVLPGARQKKLLTAEDLKEDSLTLFQLAQRESLDGWLDHYHIAAHCCHLSHFLNWSYQGRRSCK